MFLPSGAWRGYAAILGGFLLQFTMGAFYSFSNMSTYMTSYMRQHGSPNVTYTEFVVVQSTWGMTQGIVMPLSGFLIALIGEKASMISGSIIFSAGCALTYFTINKSLWMVAATYGFVSAFGQNIALIPTLTTGMKWFPQSRGKAMGIVVGGFGGGAMVFNTIQTAILNPDNVEVELDGPDKDYFTDEDLLSRVPNLLLILGGIYLGLGLFACLLITQPPPDWIDKQSKDDKDQKKDDKEDVEDSEVISSDEWVSWQEALCRKEFYLLWITRFSVVLISQVASAFNKPFGQTFIRDDHYLSLVTAITSVFNCTGRFVYGIIMDKFAYKVAMSLEATLLILLMSTLYLSSLIGIDPSCNPVNETLSNFSSSNFTTTVEPWTCDDETSVTTKVVFAVWIWAIFFTFPGTFSTQPAVTTETFGYKFGGTIYGFIFTTDIFNNLLVALMADWLKTNYGWLGLFLATSVWGFVALGATLLFPYRPRPGPRGQNEAFLAKIRGFFSCCRGGSNKSYGTSEAEMHNGIKT